MDHEEKNKAETGAVEPADQQELAAVLPEEEEYQDPSSQPHVDVVYNLTEDEVRSGLYAFQKKVLYKRNIVYTVVFSVFFLLYVIDILFRNSRSAFHYVGLVLCIVVLVFLWVNPRRHREQLAKAMATVEDDFTMTIYKKYIWIQQENGGFRIMFNDPKVFILQDSDKFIIGIGREQIFLLPKRCLDAEQLNQITEFFSGLGERFTNLKQD